MRADKKGSGERLLLMEPCEVELLKGDAERLLTDHPDKFSGTPTAAYDAAQSLKAAQAAEHNKMGTPPDQNRSGEPLEQAPGRGVTDGDQGGSIGDGGQSDGT